MITLNKNKERNNMTLRNWQLVIEERMEVQKREDEITLVLMIHDGTLIYGRKFKDRKKGLTVYHDLVKHKMKEVEVLWSSDLSILELFKVGREVDNTLSFIS